jgi:scyllo-inositol 2-dehydrogenase (NAD+)
VLHVYSEASSLVHPQLSTVGDFDNAQALLRFVGGGIGNVEVSRTAIYGYDIQTEVIGSKGTLQIGYLRHTPLTILRKGGASHDVVPHFPERFGAAYTAQIEAFIQALLKNQMPSITAEDARRALQIALAARRSHEERRIVQVAEIS